MSSMIATPRPTSYWVITILALLWNLAGVAMFCLQLNMDPGVVAALPAPQREVYEATPAWLNALFGIAVVAGLLGSVGLALKKRWAAMLFLLSLLAVLVQMAAAYAVTPAWTAYGPAGLLMPVVVTAIAAFLWWYARSAAAKGWTS